MEINSKNWRGKDLFFIKNTDEKYVVLNEKSLLFIPVVVDKNAKYKITIESKLESGNGIFFCNLFGNKFFDFSAERVECKNTWENKEFVLSTKDFPSTLPIVFRIWREKEGVGKVCIKKITIEFVESESRLKENKEIVGVMTKDKTVNVVTPSSIVDCNSKFVNNKFVKLFGGLNNGVKVLYLPLNNNEIQQTGMEEAFVDNGIQLCSYDFYSHCKSDAKGSNAFLIELARWFYPDFIHMQLQDTGSIYPDTISQIKSSLPKVYISNWTGDIRNEAIPYFIKMSKVVDLSLISSIGQLDLYRKSGCNNAAYWQIGFDPKFFYRKSEEERERLRNTYNHDIVFCGNKIAWAKFPGTELREKTISLFNNNFGNRFCAYGVGFPGSRGNLNFFKQNDVYNAAKIVLSINHFNDVEMYFSDRQLVSMASGTLTLSKYIPGLEKYFENKKDLVWFNTEEEALVLANYYLDNPDEAIEIGKNGAKKVLEEHSYSYRAKELFDMVPKPTGIDMSVVMGTFNRLKTLKEVVESIFVSARGRKIEVIINDAGSTDGTIEWLSEQQKIRRVVPIFSNKKSSITQAYNECFELARGKYVTWLSDDIFAVNNAIEEMCNLMDTLDEKDMGAFKIKNYPNEAYHMTYFANRLCPVVGGMYLSTLKKYNCFNTDYLHYAQDLEINAMVLRMGGKIVDSEACLNHVNITDRLKAENVDKFINSGNQHKFNLVNSRYGIRTDNVFPMICLNAKEEVSDIRIKDVFEKMKTYYKNANYYLTNKVINTIDGIVLKEEVTEEEFDLIINVFCDRIEIAKPLGVTDVFARKITGSI